MPAKPPSYSLAWSLRACTHAASSRPPSNSSVTVPSAIGGRLAEIHFRARRRKLSTLSVPRPAGSLFIAPPSDAQQGGDPAPVLVRRSPGDPVHGRPSQVDVDVVLPGDAETA